ncbi:glutamate racemase [candidate division KSB1 bacterium]|nr:MAG: glutamate racemase [candidate division KSB1 bacterium]
MTLERVSRPIAIFDSGLGGLTVAAEIHRRFPSENLLFLADRARVPYASLSIALIARFASECFDFLLAHDPKALVVACNTVSAVALEETVARSPVPVLGVIEPTAKAAEKATVTGRVGVLATKATVRRQAYDKLLSRLRPGVQVFSNGAPLLVPLVEEGWTEGEIPKQIVEHYLTPIRRAGVDTLVLGCTHYEYFTETMHAIMGDGVSIINTPQVTAIELEKILAARGELQRSDKPGTVIAYSTDINEALDLVVNGLFPNPVFPNQITIQSAQIPPLRAEAAR